MIRKARELEVLDGTESRIAHILEDVLRRRIRGEHVPDDSVIAAHAELMPELEEKLRALGRIEGARKIAAGGSQPGARSSSPHLSGLSPGRIEHDMFEAYELGEVAGRGATGIVYRAVQSGTGREVAIKVMIQGPFEGDADEARFEREARVLAQLKHPNIVTVYDTGWSNGRFFLVMDYVAGDQLDVWLRRHNPDLEQKLSLFAEIAETVHAAHLRGVIHRDLKPSNIRIDADGRPHLLDFGLAKVLDSDGTSTGDVPPAYVHSMTMTGQFVGSLPWASPEQAEGAPGKIDIRTDIYALGVIFYHALAGRFPYSVMGNIRDVIDRILSANPPRLSTLSSKIDHDVETIVHTCLSKEPQRRYQSAGDLAQDLRRRIAHEPIAAKRDSGWYILRKTIARHRLATSVFAGVAILTIIYAATISVYYRRAQQDAARARRTLSFLQETLFQASSHRMGGDTTLVEVLDAASKRLPNEFAGQPEIEAALQFTLGSAFESLWRKEAGMVHLRRALELNKQVHGAVHPDTHKTMLLLGMVLAEAGDAQGIRMLEEALAISRELYGQKHPMVAESLGELAFAMWAASRPSQWDEAEALYAQATTMFQETVGENADFARMLAGLASMNQERGRSAEAEQICRRACDMSRRLLGDRHQFTLECQMGLADLLVSLDRLNEAQSVLDGLQIHAIKQFGFEHTPAIVRRKVYVQIAAREYEAAERTLFETQAWVCERLAISEIENAAHFKELALTLRDKMGRKGADQAYYEALKAIQGVAPDPREAARSLVALGTIRYRQERFTYAQTLLRSCLEYLNQVKQPEYSLRVRAARMLANSLQMTNQPEEAEELLRALLQELHSSLGAQESIVKLVADDLIVIYQRSGREAEAASLRASMRL